MPREPEQDQVNVHEQIQRYVGTLKGRWYFIAVITVVCLLIGYGVAQLWPAIYQANTTFILRENHLVEKDSTLEKSLKGMKLAAKQHSLMKELKTNSRMGAVLDELGWNEYIAAQLNGSVFKFYSRIREAMSVEITQDPMGETIVNFIFEWTDPNKAAAFCRAMRDHWIDTRISNFEQQCRDHLEKAEIVLKERKQALVQTQQDLEAFDRESEYAALGTLEENNRMRANFMMEITTNEGLVEPLGRQIQNMEKELLTIPPKVPQEDKTKNPEYLKAEKQLQKLTAEYKQKEARYTESHPRLIQLKQKVEAAVQLLAELKPLEFVVSGIGEVVNPEYINKKDLLDTLRSNYETSKGKLITAEKQLKIVEERIGKLPGIMAERQAIEADINLVTEEYQKAHMEIQPLRDQMRSFESPRQREGVWETESPLRKQAFELLTPAGAKGAPENPMTLIILAVALVVGLGLGIILPLLGEFLKASFTTQEEVMNYLRKPVLGAVNRIVTETKLRAQRWRKVIYMTSSLLLIFSLVAIIYICNEYPEWIPAEIVEKVNEIREALS